MNRFSAFLLSALLGVAILITWTFANAHNAVALSETGSLSDLFVPAVGVTIMLLTVIGFGLWLALTSFAPRFTKPRVLVVAVILFIGGLGGLLPGLVAATVVGFFVAIARAPEVRPAG